MQRTLMESLLLEITASVKHVIKNARTDAEMGNGVADEFNKWLEGRMGNKAVKPGQLMRVDAKVEKRVKKQRKSNFEER